MSRGRVARALGWATLLLLAAGLAAVGLVWQGWWRLAHRPLLAEGAPAHTFYLAPGTTPAGLARDLADAGLDLDPRAFVWWGRVRGRAAHVKAGLHRVEPGATAVDLWDTLTRSGRVAGARVTIKEGWTVWQVSDALRAAGADRDDRLLDRLRDPAWIEADPALRALVPLDRLRALLAAHPGYTLAEGLLFPDTYEIGPDEGPDDLVQRASGRFVRVFGELTGGAPSASARGVTLSAYELLVLASLIERECRVADERPLVAAVLWNRLARGMRLETDPTLVYSPLEHGQVPRPRHRRDRDNPFNTYAIEGLPPTPIGAPGRASLEAALHPAPDPDLLYFVRKPGTEGRHAFARTLDEHRANVRAYRASRR